MIALLLLLACNPVESCNEPGSDCCTNDNQCQKAFDDVAPFCDGGQCVECITSGDCPGDESCETDSVVGRLCLPR